MEEKIWQLADRTADDLLTQLLINRGLTASAQQEEFLNPPTPELFACPVRVPNLNPEEFNKALSIIKKAIAEDRPIVIHGDYDVDGIGATAILWETIYFGLGYKKVYPFIPDRFGEGYGLSKKSLDKINAEYDGLNGNFPLLITVDCGVTAREEVEYAKKLGFEIVIIDHHVRPETLPRAEALVWTDSLCSGGLAWFLSYHLDKASATNQLDLAALTAVADLQPVLGINRSLLKAGLQALLAGKRLGLQALLRSAGVDGRELGTYELGWIIAPRLNAAGRLDNALTALRLLCTRDPDQAQTLAKSLNEVNIERQKITLEALTHAREHVLSNQPGKILVVAHETYHEGIIGLVAGRLTQEFSRPSLVISKGTVISKGSARSVRGFDLVAALKKIEYLFEGLGGHPMAAGFTVKTENLDKLAVAVADLGEQELAGDLLKGSIRIDVKISFSRINSSLRNLLKQLEPTGLSNPTPVFLSKGVKVTSSRTVGSSGSHLKLSLEEEGCRFPAMWFKAGEKLADFPPGTVVDIVYSVGEDSWNGAARLSLNVKDMRL
ncbi:MAG: single-stranded-DNA-specific exonuclease RecJ [Patescibacteria group bacterium]